MFPKAVRIELLSISSGCHGGHLRQMDVLQPGLRGVEMSSQSSAYPSNPGAQQGIHVSYCPHIMMLPPMQCPTSC